LPARFGIQALPSSSAVSKSVYNWQFGDFLAGVEGNFDWAVFGRPNIPLGTPLGPVQASAAQIWISTLAGRFGITSDKWLYYGKVGGGWAEDRASLSLPNGTSWTGFGGWVAGGGIEYAFKPNSQSRRDVLAVDVDERC
jgi:outer membrane immunogenic protein